MSDRHQHPIGPDDTSKPHVPPHGGDGGHGGHGDRFFQEDDRPNLGKVLAIAVAALAAFIVSVIFATGILKNVEHKRLEQGPILTPSESGKPEVGIVIQVPFEIDQRQAALTQTKQKWLESYGWIDRKAGLIHIPVDDAMKRVVAGEAPR